MYEKLDLKTFNSNAVPIELETANPIQALESCHEGRTVRASFEDTLG